jgi:hypothetical protein
MANPPMIPFSSRLKVRNQFLASSRTRGFPSHDYSWFGFICNVQYRLNTFPLDTSFATIGPKGFYFYNRGKEQMIYSYNIF